MGRPEGEARFAHGARGTPHGIFGYGDDGRQSHDGEYQTAGEGGFSDRQPESLLYQRYEYHKPEKAVHHRGNAGQQLDSRLEYLAHTFAGEFGEVDGDAEPQRERDEYRHEADQQGAEYQREYPELRGGRGGGYPLAPSEEVGRRDAVAPQYLDAGHSVGDVLVGDEGDDTRRRGDDLAQPLGQQFVILAESLLRVAVEHLLEAERDDGLVGPSDLSPVFGPVVEDIHYLCGAQVRYRIGSVDAEEIALFHGRTFEKSETLAEEEDHYQQDGDGGHGSADGEDAFYRAFEYFPQSLHG